MKIGGFAACVAAACVASAVSAETISGPRLEAVLGYDKNEGGYLWGTGGAVFGIGAGYDLPLGERFAIGADAEISGSTAKRDLRYYLGDGSHGTYAQNSAGRDLYAGVRVTGAVTERFALYAKGGYTNAQLKWKPVGDTGSLTERGGEKRGGWRLGAGGRYSLGNIYVGAEYRYSDYGEISRIWESYTRSQLVGVLGWAISADR